MKKVRLPLELFLLRFAFNLIAFASPKFEGFESSDENIHFYS
jgi:hypothetical protein